MTDEPTDITTVQPTTVQPDPSAPQTTTEDWEARYKGTGTTINALNEQIKTLSAQLDAKSSEFEQLQAQLSLKDTEKNVAVGERDKQITTFLEEKTLLDSELNRLRALEAKVKVANEIGDTSLVSIFDSIPDVADEETLKTLMNQISTWGEDRVKERENVLLAGVVDQPVVTPPVPETLPTDNKGWQAYVDKFDLGTPERESAFEAWKQWGLTSQQ